MAIDETTDSAATARTRARARKPKEGKGKMDVRKLPPGAHAAAAAALLEKEQAATARKRERKRGPAHPAIAGKVYVVACTKCGDLKARKHFSDANGWRRRHAEANKSHTIVIEQRNSDEVAKKANRKDGQKNA